eukprot:CAMPEP_0119557410 /NCGR_PEP_ID=MMETSP1352-20130426/9087_1 /TAXON_ID=265584 /ORGANISM="Stauroneis constricta, Strain CCMP1120" /LENGTH=346 /DNA_ID=CAMNT_0007604513 /DNA_START=104 /DNA_END=1144 /DNA_ORIENTATION=+
MTTMYESRQSIVKNKTKVHEDRVRAMLLGGICADAASMGTHWIYDKEEMKKAVPSIEAPEFKDPATPSYYSSDEFPGHYEAGMLSPWGEQLLFVTEYCGEHQCVTAGHLSVRMKKWAETFGGRQDHNTKDFLKCMIAGDRSVELCGADNLDANFYMKVIPVVSLYAGELDMLDRVKEAIMVTQTNAKVIHFGQALATLLETLLLGSNLKTALEKVVEFAITGGHDDVMDACLRALGDAKSKSLDDVEIEGESMGGRACSIPGNFIISMFLLYKASADADVTTDAQYIQAIRANILCAGDTTSRAIMIGAVLAAASGSIPADFKEKTNSEIIEKVEKAATGVISVLN